MSITIVAAISKNNCIGKQGKLPWNIPEDMKRVKKLTTGKVIIMGRKTWESIPEKFRPLPNRLNIVITRNTDYSLPDNVEKYPDIKSAVIAHKNEKIIGFGGQHIFEEMIQIADTLNITEVNQTIEDGDTFFPKIDKTIWKEIWREPHNGFDFVEYKKIYEPRT